MSACMRFTDAYDEIMASAGSVSECMINALTDSDKTTYGQEAAKLIIAIEKKPGITLMDTQIIAILKIELATLIIDATSADATDVARDIVDRGAA